MTDALGVRVDGDMTSQHPRDRSLPISTSQAFILSATSGVAGASFFLLVFWDVIRWSYRCWYGCVKGAIQCLLVFVMGFVLLCAFDVLQNVGVRHDFGIAVLIIDGVVVTCWMIFCDLSIERVVSRKVFGDRGIKDWVAIVCTFFDWIVVWEDFLSSRCWDFRVWLWRWLMCASTVMTCESWCCYRHRMTSRRLTPFVCRLGLGLLCYCQGFKLQN